MKNNNILRKLTFILALVMLATTVMPMSAMAQTTSPSSSIGINDDVLLPGIDPPCNKVQPDQEVRVTITVGSWHAIVNGNQGTITSSLIDAVPSSSGPAAWLSGVSRTITVPNVPAGGKTITVTAVIMVRPPGLFSVPVQRQVVRQVWIERWTTKLLSS